MLSVDQLLLVAWAGLLKPSVWCAALLRVTEGGNRTTREGLFLRQVLVEIILRAIEAFRLCVSS